MCPVGTFSIAYGPMQWQDGDWVLSRRTVSRENDLNSDASIDLSEFMDAFGGSVWTGAQVEALFTQMDINDNGLPLQEAVISGDWVSLLDSGDHQMPLETEPVDQARRRRRLNPPAMPSRARAPGAGTWAT